jgi:hypothetical protein
MSELPQRKKSPEEIARMREEMGIPGDSSADNAAANRAEIAESTAGGESQSPLSEPIQPRQVRSLKRSERMPVIAAAIPDTPDDPPPSGTGPVAKPVRSLRKSEQVPTLQKPAPAPPDSKLPGHRHSDEELLEIRRRAALDAQMNPIPQKPLKAHPALYVPGYLLALAGAVCVYQDLDRLIPLACEIAAALVAAYVFIKRPHSRHHAAFIAVAVLFVLVFGALHYFPQLRHAP